MPTVITIDGFRFFFYSNENNEPPHVHVEKADGTAKIWLSPVRVEYMIGFTPRQQKAILAHCNENLELFKEKWNEYFK
jgi:hypothetical protein